MTPCAWDGYDAYLFDIDGTLLHCRDAVHYFAFCNALERVAGRRMTLEGVVANEMQKTIANAQANGVSGVFSVANNLRVESKN